MIEHTPNRDSRITVSREQRDEIGLPRVHLDMRYGEPEFDTIAAAIGCLASELGPARHRTRALGRPSATNSWNAWARRRVITWAQRVWLARRARASSTSNAASTA